MAREPTFTQIIVSQLGTPKEPLGLDDLLLLAALLASGAIYIALEVAFGRQIARLFDRVRGKDQEGEKEQRSGRA